MRLLPGYQGWRMYQTGRFYPRIRGYVKNICLGSSGIREIGILI